MISFEVNSVHIIINLLLAVLSRLVPKKKNLILFGAGRGEVYKGNPKYIFEYIITTKFPELKPLWITANKDVYKSLKNDNLPVVFKFSLNGFLSVLWAEFIIIDFSVKDFSYMGTLFGRFSIIQTWHGIALKYIGLDEFKNHEQLFNSSLFKSVYSSIKKYLQTLEYKKYRFIIAASNTEAENIGKAFNTKNIIITGFPRNDILFAKYSKELLPAKFRKSDKIFLYAPTFRDSGYQNNPFSDSFLVQLDNYLKKTESIMLVKKHPHDKSLIISGYENIIDVNSLYDDIQQLLCFTDLLITDYSSVFFDFVLTGKPVIFYSYDYEYYLSQCRGMYFDYYETVPGPFAKNEAELMKLLISHKKWSVSKNYRQSYNSFADRFHKYRDNYSTSRFLTELVSLQRS
ncbi:MAG: CDP-glycerol glycerophosphotransferase family protein [Spirochaetes bacterium]|jgi:CDP-glycerol glycerophosphotransferase (TagB/SpsB family)|nr:CDP-glycerol glycerophosphotransferase family protein [Spirochaetota bacterium]